MEKYLFKKLSLMLLCSGLLFVFSCADDDDPLTEDIRKNVTVNEWIQGNMEVLYFWNTHIPTKTDKTLYPADYFDALLFKPEDRFSFIAEDFAQLNEQLSGVTLEAGYDFSLFLKEANGRDLLGVIDYIKPNSPASSSDLSRGDIFFTINNRQLTIDNYIELIKLTASPHTLGISRDGKIEPLSLSVIKYEDNPLYLDSIFETGGKKIAYLIYNFFATDNGDNSYSYLKELNDVFGKYKQENIDELILDLRYNSGGLTSVASALAGMISGRQSSDVFSIDEYNSIVDKEMRMAYGDDYNKTYFDDFIKVFAEDGKTIIQSIPLNKLSGLTRLYVLTSRNTASASEMVINGLKPYMNVILIGDETVGKNMGMWFIYESDPVKQRYNRWGMLPIVAKINNSRNEANYSDGFTPDIKVNEYQKVPLSPLGDAEELLLGAALQHIGALRAGSPHEAESASSYTRLTSSRNITPARNVMIIDKK